MKLSALIVLAVAANMSFAAPMFCSGTNGFRMSVSSNLKKAKVEKNNRPVMFGDLNCATLYPRCIPKPGEQCRPVLMCNTAEHVADAGFHAIIRLELPGKEIKGSLSSQSIMGPRKVSDLKCVAAVH